MFNADNADYERYDEKICDSLLLSLVPKQSLCDSKISEEEIEFIKGIVL